MRRIYPAMVFLVVPFFAFPQMSNLRIKYISTRQDSVILDSVSIVPGSLYLLSSEGVADTSAYSIDAVQSLLKWKKNSTAYLALHHDSLEAHYRTFSFSFAESVSHKDASLLSKPGASGMNQYVYNPSESQPSFFKYEGLQKAGSISRGVTFGNNQDVFVNSSLNLQLNGKIGNGIDLLASITDENIPVQPEGNTQQLQEFDKVFIQFSKDRNKLIAGDFELRRPDSYFMNFFKRGQGAYASTSFLLNDSSYTKKNRTLNSAASLAIAKGRFSRAVFNGTEGNQGPYRLNGNEGEKFIIVLSGTEKVFIDGQLMKRGMQNDYVIDYNTAEITFMPKRLITKDSRIIIEFEYSDRKIGRAHV